MKYKVGERVVLVNGKELTIYRINKEDYFYYGEDNSMAIGTTFNEKMIDEKRTIELQDKYRKEMTASIKTEALISWSEYQNTKLKSKLKREADYD